MFFYSIADEMSQKSSASTTSFIIPLEEDINQLSLLSKPAIESAERMASEKPLPQNQQFKIKCTGVIPNCHQNSDQNSQHYSLDEMLPRPPPYPSQGPYCPIASLINSNIPPPDGGFMLPKQASISSQQSLTDAPMPNDNCNFFLSRQSVISQSNQLTDDERSRSIDCNHSVPSEEETNNNQTSPHSITIDQNGQAIQTSAIADLTGDRRISGSSNQTLNISQVSDSNMTVYKQAPHVIHISNETNNSSHRSSLSSLESSASNSAMPSIRLENGKLLKGSSPNEILKNWLSSIKCDQYCKNFIDNGYDIQLLPRMTPQDLTAIGCKSPEIRKKLLNEIKKLKLKDGIPECRFNSLEQWLERLKLQEYYSKLCTEGYNSIDKVCELTWEDLEEIGIYKLGHQKRLILGIEGIKRFDRIQEERLNESMPIYDVHPNHRISLNGGRVGTLSRGTLRPAMYGARSGMNLDSRGVPVATVMPALKHVNSSMTPLDIDHQNTINTNGSKGLSNRTSNCNFQINNAIDSFNQPTYDTTQRESIYGIGIQHQRPLSTLRRNPPPLPPVRTNSLKISTMEETNTNESIYGNNSTLQPNCNNIHIQSNGPTSFLRTPKLGTLTATTNKMLQNGGHVETITTQTVIRNSIPIREAPLPPGPRIPEEIEEVSGRTRDKGCGGPNSNRLTDDEEFPPPPPISTINN